MNEYKLREQGQEAERVLTSPVYAEAWTAYRARILEEIEAAKSNDHDTVMHLKRLLSAASAARLHLERIMKEGAVSAKNIEIDEQRGKLSSIARVFGVR